MMTADRTDQALSFRGVGPPKIDIEDEKDDFLQESAYLQVPCETSGVYDNPYWFGTTLAMTYDIIPKDTG